jgi:multiple sugar transport system ATP-binding protein
MGVRPENIHDEEMYLAQFPDSQVEMGVEVVELMGSETYLYMHCEGRQVTARVSPRSTTRSGDKIKVAFDSKKIHLFDKETEKAFCH